MIVVDSPKNGLIEKIVILIEESFKELSRLDEKCPGELFSQFSSVNHVVGKGCTEKPLNP